jgi:Na+-transporting NADH:ubiquinone oxidoreductase subunit NqrE
MEHAISLFFRSIFVDNMIFAYFLGMCSYLAVSKNVKTSLGLGLAVTFVLLITVPVDYLLQTKVLSADGILGVDLTYLSFILFIAVIAGIVQLVEMIVEKFSPSLYAALGWILPRTDQFSTSRSYLSWLFGKKKEYNLDARVKGGERHMIMSGEYDKVLPMDIYGEYLIKTIIAGDIDKQEQLGIYEVSPEDFAVAEFVDSSKLELQKIVREGLNTLRKENA